MFGHRDPEVTLVSGAQAKFCTINITYPDIEIQIPICDGLDVESNGGNGGNDFADL